ncbi:MAG: RagB/SusD family nutrient uptake outer membrane protein [Rikenellaceae bacterium]|nr:RagB/SusD family nutrient uptake outer membrane protein [Rikenellaceae bacterium]
MKKILLIPLVALSVLLVPSCGLLDVDIESDITGDSYWKSEGDVTGFLNGLHNRLRDLLNSNYQLREDRSDAFVAGLEGSVSAAWAHNLTQTNAPSWLGHYTLLHNCNLLLKYAPDIEPNTTAIDRGIASTYAIRAYVYFMLTRAWGDVPIVLEPTESDKSPLPARAPAADVIAQILEDIESALELFPEEGYLNKNIVSKPMVYALKADVLLWKYKVTGGTENDLLDAIEAADMVLASGVGLLEDFPSVFSAENKTNNEIVFSLYFKRDEKSDHYGSRLKARDIFVANAANAADIAYSISGSRSVYQPSEAAKNIFPAGDVRRVASVITAVDAAGNVIGDFDNKFRGLYYEGVDRYWEDDLIVYRAAEMYLFKAEAYAALDRTGDAITQLNYTRRRAGTGDYTGSADRRAVEQEILDERFREFWLEQRRWPDLVRFHYGGTINVYDVVPNLRGKSVPLFLPILKTEMDLNHNLEQTKGY